MWWRFVARLKQFGIEHFVPYSWIMIFLIFAGMYRVTVIFWVCFCWIFCVMAMGIMGGMGLMGRPFTGRGCEFGVGPLVDEIASSQLRSSQ